MKQFSMLRTLLYFLSIGLAFVLSCKKNNNDPNDERGPEPTYETLSVHATGEFTFVIKDNGELWVRGKYYTPWTDNSNGYYLLDKNVQSMAMDVVATSPRKVFMIKNDHTVWMSKTAVTQQPAVITEIMPAVQITDNAQKVIAGRGFAVILKTDGTVWAIGVNRYGQFGTGEKDTNPRWEYDENFPVIPIAEDVKDIAAGWSNIYLVKTDGTLWSAGGYVYGKLGYEAESDQLTFKRVEAVDDVVSVKAFANQAMVLRSNGEVWSFGSNANGTQNNGESSIHDAIYPHKVADDVKDIFSGDYTAYVLKNDRTLWACGSNRHGQMGVATPDHSYKYTQIAENVEDITIGDRTTIILQNGKMRMAGDNREKQLSQSSEEKFTTFTTFTMP